MITLEQRIEAAEETIEVLLKITEELADTIEENIGQRLLNAAIRQMDKRVHRLETTMKRMK